MEVIHEVLIPNGWANPTITDQASLLIFLREVSKLSEEALSKGGKLVTVDIELGFQVK
jgi:hypothetical protein